MLTKEVIHIVIIIAFLRVIHHLRIVLRISVVHHPSCIDGCIVISIVLKILDVANQIGLWVKPTLIVIHHLMSWGILRRIHIAMIIISLLLFVGICILWFWRTELLILSSLAFNLFFLPLKQVLLIYIQVHPVLKIQAFYCGVYGLATRILLSLDYLSIEHYHYLCDGLLKELGDHAAEFTHLLESAEVLDHTYFLCIIELYENSQWMQIKLFF